MPSRQGHNPNKPFVEGKDKYITEFLVQHGYCGPCERGGLTVYIKKLELPDGIDREKTILKRHYHKLGILCGCYAKFHRQMAHIQDIQRTIKEKKLR